MSRLCLDVGGNPVLEIPKVSGLSLIRLNLFWEKKRLHLIVSNPGIGSMIFQTQTSRVNIQTNHIYATRVIHYWSAWKDESCLEALSWSTLLVIRSRSPKGKSRERYFNNLTPCPTSHNITIRSAPRDSSRPNLRSYGFLPFQKSLWLRPGTNLRSSKLLIDFDQSIPDLPRINIWLAELLSHWPSVEIHVPIYLQYIWDLILSILEFYSASVTKGF